MAWTTPKTWSAGETLTAANYNQQFRDNLNLVPHVVYKTADQSVTSSTAFVDDTHLTFAIGSSEAWTFRFVLHSTGPGFLKVALNAPTAAAGWWAFSYESAGVTNTDPQAAATFVDGETFGTAAQPDVNFLDGYVLNSSTAGTFKLRWAQLNSNGTATILKKGSFMDIRRVT